METLRLSWSSIFISFLRERYFGGQSSRIHPSLSPPNSSLSFALYLHIALILYQPFLHSLTHLSINSTTRALGNVLTSCKLQLLLLGSSLLVQGLHGREEDDFLDVVLIGKQHDEAIDTESPSTSGRETVLHRSAEVLINGLSFVITSSRISNLGWRE